MLVKIKKLVLVVLSALMIFTFTAPSFAKSSVDIEQDIYVNNVQENVLIQDKEYNYKYSYNSASNDNITYITDTQSGQSDTLIHDKETGIFYLNGQKVAEIKDDLNIPTQILRAGSYWKYISNSSTYISWKKGLAAAVVAGIIAGALGQGATVVAVLGSVGASTLGYISSSFVGGRLYWTKWYHVNLLNYHYKIDWAIKAPNGKRFGTYYIQYTLE